MLGKSFKKYSILPNGSLIVIYHGPNQKKHTNPCEIGHLIHHAISSIQQDLNGLALDGMLGGMKCDDHFGSASPLLQGGPPTSYK